MNNTLNLQVLESQGSGSNSLGALLFKPEIAVDTPGAKIPVFDLVMGLSHVLDLVAPALVDHHSRTAYIAMSLARTLGLPMMVQQRVMLAGLLHDIGALSLKERLDLLEFEAKNPERHMELGYQLFKGFSPLAEIAVPIRYHHRYWENGRGSEGNGEAVPVESHLLHLADRIADLGAGAEEILEAAPAITVRIAGQSGRMFVPEMVDAFRLLAEKEYFWLDSTSPTIDEQLKRQASMQMVPLGMNGVAALAELFSHIIDFRSPFTVTHASGVAATAEMLARLHGFTPDECGQMRVAGYLHDLGKLAVPEAILEKPEKLTPAEFNIIKRHTYHTYRVLESMQGTELIATWAAFHHEKLDGSGYPFHLTACELSPGARIMAVADIFTALTEDRPYRAGLPVEQALQILHEKVTDRAIDGDIVATLLANVDDLNVARTTTQHVSRVKYRQFREMVE